MQFFALEAPERLLFLVLLVELVELLLSFLTLFLAPRAEVLFLVLRLSIMIKLSFQNAKETG